jgi:hypothetical protein
MTPTRLKAVALLAVGLAVALVVAACSGSPAASQSARTGTSTSTGMATSQGGSTSVPAGATTQACGLVTEQEVRIAIGANPGAGQPFSSHGSTQCQFGSYQSGFVLVNLTPSHGVAGYDLMHKNPKVSPSGHVADLAGVGDRAFEITAPHTASIYFDKGDVLVLVMVETQKVAPPVAQVLSLAKSAAGRI